MILVVVQFVQPYLFIVYPRWTIESCTVILTNPISRLCLKIRDPQVMAISGGKTTPSLFILYTTYEEPGDFDFWGTKKRCQTTRWANGQQRWGCGGGAHGHSRCLGCPHEQGGRAGLATDVSYEYSSISYDRCSLVGRFCCFLPHLLRYFSPIIRDLALTEDKRWWYWPGCASYPRSIPGAKRNDLWLDHPSCVTSYLQRVLVAWCCFSMLFTHIPHVLFVFPSHHVWSGF